MNMSNPVTIGAVTTPMRTSVSWSCCEESALATPVLFGVLLLVGLVFGFFVYRTHKKYSHER